MKKFLAICITFVGLLLLTGCGSSDSSDTKEVDLDAINADANLKDILYQQVCFNQYKIKNYNVIGEKTYYLHDDEVCYYIKTTDLPDNYKEEGLKLFEDKSYNGFLSKGEIILVDKDTHGAKEYNSKTEDYLPLPPICRLNDTDSDECISTYWKIGDGFNDNYGLIHIIG